MTRKGQITLEALLLYGVAILVVLLAIGALTYFGVLDLGRLLPDRCDLTSSGAISCAEFAVTQNQIQLGIKNVGSTGVTISKATFTTESGGPCTYVASAPSSGIAIPSGKIVAVDLSCTAGTNKAITQPVGKKVKGELQIDYMNDGGAITNPVGGSLVATVAS